MSRETHGGIYLKAASVSSVGCKLNLHVTEVGDQRRLQWSCRGEMTLVAITNLSARLKK